MEFEPGSQEELIVVRVLGKICDALVGIGGRTHRGFDTLGSDDSVRAFSRNSGEALPDIDPQAYTGLLKNLKPAFGSYEELRDHRRFLQRLEDPNVNKLDVR